MSVLKEELCEFLSWNPCLRNYDHEVMSHEPWGQEIYTIYGLLKIVEKNIFLVENVH